MAWLELLAQVIVGLERLHAQTAAEPPLATRVGRAAGLLGLAVYAGILASLALTAAGCLVLAETYSTPVALAICGGAFAAIALVAIILEFGKRSHAPTPKPAAAPVLPGKPVLAQAVSGLKTNANKLRFDVPTLAIGALVAGLTATTAILASQPHVFVTAPKASLPKAR
jgi:hypothetical protein